MTCPPGVVFVVTPGGWGGPVHAVPLNISYNYAAIWRLTHDSCGYMDGSRGILGVCRFGKEEEVCSSDLWCFCFKGLCEEFMCWCRLMLLIRLLNSTGKAYFGAVNVKCLTVRGV